MKNKPGMRSIGPYLMGLMGMWPWCCTSVMQNNPLKLYLDWISLVVTVFARCRSLSLGLVDQDTGLILGLRPANERRHYFVTTSLIGWAQTYNQPWRYMWEVSSLRPGPRFNIKISSHQYRKSHCRDKTVVRSSYLQNGISYSGKTASLYCIRVEVMNICICKWGHDLLW